MRKYFVDPAMVVTTYYDRVVVEATSEDAASQLVRVMAANGELKVQGPLVTEMLCVTHPVVDGEEH